MFEAILRFAIPAMWIAWLVYWAAAARATKPNRWREPGGSRLRHAVPFILAALLLAAPHTLPAFMRARFLPYGYGLPALGTVLVAAGLGLAIVARRHLGTNWSGIITIKQGHTLICSGPYAYIRHPIYAGLLLAFLGTALVIGEWRGIFASILALFACLHKIKVEESGMRQEFRDYKLYCERTAALIPFIF